MFLQRLILKRNVFADIFKSRKNLSKLAYQFIEKKKAFYTKRVAQLPVNHNEINQNKSSRTNNEEKKTKLEPILNSYKILGLKDNATYYDVKRAYYVLAKKFHSDRLRSKNPMEFQNITEAYNILCKVKREDVHNGFSKLKEKRVPQPLASTHYRINEQTRKLAKILRLSEKKMKDYERAIEMKINYPPPQCLKAGEMELAIPFLVSIRGTKRRINVRSFVMCSACNGGNEKVGAPKVLALCDHCNGAGYLLISTDRKRQQKVCCECKGTRYVLKYNCKKCQNRGYELLENSVKIEIPPGVNTNDIIYVENPGDTKKVAVRIKVRDSNHFKRCGNDIYTEKKITLTEAIIGGEFRIRGIYGDIKFNIPPGIQNLTMKRLRGCGVKGVSETGDFIITFRVQMPKSLSAKQKEIVNMLQKSENFSAK